MTFLRILQRGQSRCHFGASVDQACKDVQYSLTLAAGADEHTKVAAADCAASGKWEGCEGRVRCPLDLVTRTRFGPHALVHLQPCGALGLAPHAWPTSTRLYFCTSHASASSAHHSMLLYSTSCCEHM